MLERERRSRFGGWFAPGLVALALVGPAARAQRPLWRQEPPIGGVRAFFSYSDANDDLVVFSGYASGPRIWRFDTSWHEVLTDPSPPGFLSVFPGLAYDPVRQVVVYAGAPQTNQPTETWEFDGATWVQRQPSNRPPTRNGAAMAYDPIRQCVVLYGGYGAGPLNDTWQYDGNDWIQLTPANAPGLRGSAMAFDENLQQLLLVGHQAFGSTTSETWRFDGTNWHQMISPTQPEARGLPRLAFDRTSQRMVLTGGGPVGSFPATATDNTWLFDGSQWQRLPISPPGWLGSDLAWWPPLGAVVAVGGAAPNEAPRGAMYALSASSWYQVTAESPVDRLQPLLAYDSQRACLVLHGGRSRSGQWVPGTYEWRSGQGWSWTSLGAGPGSADGMAYDPVLQCVVAVSAGTTWTYDGSWTATAVAPAPSAGAIWFDRHARCTKVAAAGQVWSFDGQAWTSAPTLNTLPNAQSVRYVTHSSALRAAVAIDNQTEYVFDGVQWQPLLSSSLGAVAIADAPTRGALVMRDLSRHVTWSALGVRYWSPRQNEELEGSVYTTDVATGEVYAVSRVGQVWRLGWEAVGAVASFGLGCPGSGGVPDLRPVGPSTPVLGGSLALLLTDLPASPGSAILMFGDAIDRWDHVPLPVALDPIGLPGCRAWIPARSFTVQPFQGGALAWPLALPAAPALAGELLGIQALVPDAANPAGWASTSNALLITAY